MRISIGCNHGGFERKEYLLNNSIRPGVVSNGFSAKATRKHNNTNVLCLGERVIGKGFAIKIVE